MNIRSYSDLSAYVHSHASDPLKLAKVLTAWEWTSWNPWSDPVLGPAKSVYDLDRVMHGACGWRMILLETLFAEIGIKSRSVQLYDVAVQGGHNAVELFINGKWMFFDGTFGTYFEKNGVVLSLEELRANWPNVTVKQSNLPGWTGVRMDPADINPQKVFSTKTDTFFAHPGLTDRIDDISGEIYTLFLAPHITYKEDGIETALDSGGRNWSIKYNTAKNGSWKKIVTSYDATGRKDSQHTTYGNKDEKFVILDPHNQYGWTKKITYTQDNFYIKYTITTFDNGSKIVDNFDGRRQYDWSHNQQIFTAGGRLDKSIIEYDNGTKWVYDLDEGNGGGWSSREDSYDKDGSLTTSLIRYDDGHTVTLDWAQAEKQVAAPEGGVLTSHSNHSVLQGLGGGDILIGGMTEDLLAGGGGNDIYYVSHPGATVLERFGEGIDAVNASVDFVLPDYVENLFLIGRSLIGTGNSANNQITGNEQDNILRGLDGDDTLIGGLGVDRLEGGKGNDIYYVENSLDVVYERAHEGVDTVNSTVNYTLPNYVENLFLSGEAIVGIGNRENNLIIGDAQDNVLKGLDGNDTLYGGEGQDVLYGNAGADQFVWRTVQEMGKGSSADNVRDFSYLEGDRLNVSLIDANSLMSGRQHFTFVGETSTSGPGQISYTHSGGKTFIHFNTDYDPLDEGTIILDGWHTPTASWFLL